MLSVVSSQSSNTTYAAIGPGDITLTRPEDQSQDIAALNRTPDTAHATLTDRFDPDRIRDEQDMAQSAADLGRRITQDISQAMIDRATAGLDPDSAEYQEAYQAAQQQYGIGSPFWAAAMGMTNALSATMGGGNEGAIAAGGLSPLISYGIGEATESGTVENIAAHIMLGAMTAHLSGGNAIAGGVGAGASAALSGAVHQYLFGDKAPEDLTEQERQTLSAYMTMIGALSGAAAAGSDSVITSTAQGAAAARNEVENNFLGNTSARQRESAIERIRNGDNSIDAAQAVLSLSEADRRSDILLARFRQDPSQLTAAEQRELQTYLQAYAYEMGQEYGQEVAQELVQVLLTWDGDYLRAAPDTEAQRIAQSILNRWSNLEWQQSMGGDAVLLVSGPLGATIRATVAAGGALQMGVGVGEIIDEGVSWSAAGNIASGALAMSAATVASGIARPALTFEQQLRNEMAVTRVSPALLEELAANGVRFTPENIVIAGRSSTGQVVFLETGSKGDRGSGLAHIIENHLHEFESIGVSQYQIPNVLMQAVHEGRIVGYQGTRPIYETVINGQTQRIAITVSNNGYIVGANMRSAK